MSRKIQEIKKTKKVQQNLLKLDKKAKKKMGKSIVNQSVLNVNLQGKLTPSGPSMKYLRKKNLNNISVANRDLPP